MRDVQQPVTLRCVLPAAGGVFPAHLVYRESDPWAVRLCVHNHHRDDADRIVWTFSRDLLLDGMTDQVGMGDVTIAPAPSPHAARGRQLWVTLTSPEGSAVLAVDAGVVQRFLARTFAVVPAGCEVMDWEPVLSRLLDVGGGSC